MKVRLYVCFERAVKEILSKIVSMVAGKMLFYCAQNQRFTELNHKIIEDRIQKF